MSEKIMKMNIGQFCCKLILETNMTNQQIADAAVEVFGGKTTVKSIAWYKTDLRKQGLLVDKVKGTEVDLSKWIKADETEVAE
jgi:hypothetical protein